MSSVSQPQSDSTLPPGEPPGEPPSVPRSSHVQEARQGAALPPRLPEPKELNQIYYSEIAVGVWRGQFRFTITDFKRFFLEGLSADKALSLALHAVCRGASRHVFIDSAFRCPRGSLEARALARVSLKPGFPAPDLGVYRLRVAYDLDKSGDGAKGVLSEHLGLLFGRSSKSDISSKISEKGLRADYKRTGFGTEWRGTYHVSPCRNRVTVTYKSSWGEIHYDTQRVRPTHGAGSRSDAPEVKHAVERLGALADELARAGFAADQRDALVALFLDVYGSATAAIIDALRFGVSVPSTRSYDRETRRFSDPKWVAKLGELFGLRLLEALRQYNAHGRCHPAWQVVFDALAQQPMTGLDALALCAYAHITFDLPYALADSAPGGLDAHIEDYELVNRVLADHIDTVQRQLAGLYGTRYAWLDTLAGQYDEVFVGQRIHETRARAWYFATRLLRARDDDRLEEVERFLLHGIETFADALLAPRPAPLTAVARLSRALLQAARRRTLTGEFR